MTDRAIKITPVSEFVIDRKIWLRGEGSVTSYLLRKSDAKMCCVGIWLESCGMPKEELLGEKTVYGSFPTLINDQLPEWSRDHNDVRTTIGRLYAVNDRLPEHISEEEREAKIVKLFADVGIKVTFIN